jgi:hypothetical protein
MSGHDWFVDTAVLFGVIIVWGLAYEAMCWWQKRKTWRRFNRDQRRIVLGAERYRR